MVLVYTSGRLGALKVGDSYTTVLGVQKMDISISPKRDWPRPPKDSTNPLIMFAFDWQISGKLTEDLADAGQDAIRAAFFYRDSLPFQAYRDATHYYTSEAEVTRYDTSVDPEGHVEADFTLSPYPGYMLECSL